MVEPHSFARALLGLRAQASPLKRAATSLQLRCFQNPSALGVQFSPNARCYNQSTLAHSLISTPSHSHSSRPSIQPRHSRAPELRQYEASRGVRVSQSRCYAIKADSQFGEMTEDQYSKSPDRFKRLSPKDIHNIFGPGMDAKQGNRLLNTIQKQRVTGTLDVNISGPNVTKATIAKSLAWLREKYPLDEDAAIMARLEREEQTIREDWRPQQDVDPENVYGESVLDKVRATNVEIERLKDEEEKAEQERLEKEEQEGVSGPLSTNRKESFKELARPRKTAEWVEKYRQRAMLSTSVEVIKPSTFKVLVPTGLFAFAIVALCIGLALEYEPPPREARLFPDIPPAAATIGALICINTLVWFLWKIPPLWRTMNINMLLVPATPHPFALVGNVFSHQLATHLLANMLGMWFIGTSLHDEIGRGRFLAIYFGCGVTASWLSLLRFAILKNFTLTSLGASGALMGVIGTYCTLYPQRLITIGLLPRDLQEWFCIRADWIFWLIFSWEAYNVFRKSFRIDHVAHLGGLVSGAVGAEMMKRQARNKRKRHARLPRPTLGF